MRQQALQTVPLIDADGVSPAPEVPDQFVAVRTNPVTGATEVLGLVGAGYTAIQNEAHADLLDMLVDESGSLGVDLPGQVASCRMVQVTS